MVAQSPEPGAHVLNAQAFRIELEFRNVGFCGEGKTGVPGEKPLGAQKRTNNKLNPHMTSSPGIEPGHIGGRRVLSPLRHPCSPVVLWSSLSFRCRRRCVSSLRYAWNCKELKQRRFWATHVNRKWNIFSLKCFHATKFKSRVWLFPYRGRTSVWRCSEPHVLWKQVNLKRSSGNLRLTDDVRLFS